MRFRMGDFAARPEGFQHAAAPDHEGERVLRVDAVKPHRKVCSHIEPEGHLLFLPGPGVGPGKCFQVGLGFDEPEELCFEEFARRLHGVKLAVAQCFHDERPVFLEDDEVHLPFRKLLPAHCLHLVHHGEHLLLRIPAAPGHA